MGIGMVAHFPAECVCRTQGMQRRIVDKMSVAKECGGGEGVGVVLVIRGEHGEDIFERF